MQPDARSSEASWPASRRGAREGPARGPWPRVRTVEPRFVVRLICSGCEHRRTQRRGRARKEEGGAPRPPLRGRRRGAVDAHVLAAWRCPRLLLSWSWE